MSCQHQAGRLAWPLVGRSAPRWSHLLLPAAESEESLDNPRLLPACHVGGSCSWGHNYYLTSTGSGCSPSPTPNPTFGQRREIYAFMAGLALRWPCTQNGLGGIVLACKDHSWWARGRHSSTPSAWERIFVCGDFNWWAGGRLCAQEHTGQPLVFINQTNQDGRIYS